MTTTRQTLIDQVHEVTPKALRFINEHRDSVGPMLDRTPVCFGDAHYGQACRSLLQVVEVYVPGDGDTDPVELVFSSVLRDGDELFDTILAQDSLHSGLVKLDELRTTNLQRASEALQVLSGALVDPVPPIV